MFFCLVERADVRPILGIGTGGNRPTRCVPLPQHGLGLPDQIEGCVVAQHDARPHERQLLGQFPRSLPVAERTEDEAADLGCMQEPCVVGSGASDGDDHVTAGTPEPGKPAGERASLPIEFAVGHRTLVRQDGDAVRLKLGLFCHPRIHAKFPNGPPAGVRHDVKHRPPRSVQPSRTVPCLSATTPKAHTTVPPATPGAHSHRSG